MNPRQSPIWFRRIRADDDATPATYESRQREADRRFVRALAIAISNGDHIPQAMRAAA